MDALALSLGVRPERTVRMVGELHGCERFGHALAFFAGREIEPHETELHELFDRGRQRRVQRAALGHVADLPS